MASLEIGPAEVVALELMAVIDRASDAAVDARGRYSAFVARERAKGLLCQRGRARGPAAKWAGANKERNLVRRGRAVVSPILFDCRRVRLPDAGIQTSGHGWTRIDIYGGRN